MPIPVGTYPVLGPIIDISGSLLTATPALRDANVISLYGGRIRKINAAGDDWEDAIEGGGTVTSITSSVHTVTVVYNDSGGVSQTLELNRFTDTDRHDLNSIPGLLAKTADLAVESSARSWGDLTDENLGAFASDSSGNLGPSHASALTYHVSITGTLQTATNNFVYLRIPLNRDVRDYRLQQSGSLGDFFITSWDHVGEHDSFNYYRSRHNLFEAYQITVQYDAVTAIQTHYRGETEWDHIQGTDGARPSTAQIATGTDDTARPWAVEDVVETIGEHERFTDVEQDILEDLSRQTFPHPTDDWQIRQTYVAHDFFTDRYAVFLSLGWDADNRLRALSADGHVGRLGRQDLGRIYDGSERLRGGLISGVHWLYLRDDGVGSAIIRAPVDGGDSDPEFSIVLRYFSMFADPDSGTLLGILRRISATEMEVGLLAYDAVAGTITAEDTITVTRAHLDAALGADYAPLSDIHRESATGVYQDVAGAILEGATLYLMLTDIAKTDGHTASVLVGFTLAGTPNNRTLTILAENAVDELPVSDELTSGILPLEADELFLARDTTAYRLSGPEPGIVATDDTITGDGSEDRPISVADPYPGAVTWPTLSDRPNRPTAQEIIDGNSVDEAVPSVSDIVAVANSHSQRTLANDDPEPVGATADEGTEGTVSRRDHVHALPTDSTLEFDPVSGDLGVNVHDVITHLQESIRYYTDSIDHPTDPGGHSAGQMYRTGPFPTTISRVQSQIDVLFGHPSYAARIYHVDSDREVLEFLGESSHFVPLSNNPHSYDFTVDDGIGIPIPANSFIVILFHAVGGVLIPLRTGDEASDSPGKSYQDADRDFNMVNSVVYADVHPSVGDSTASHGDADHIRGNIKIFYDIAYDHGQLLGDGKANTDLQNIDEDLTADEQLAVRTRIGAASSSQQMAGVARVGEHTEIILWTYAPLNVTPSPPAPPWNDADQTFLANLGFWHSNKADALAARTNASDALWIVYGGTDNVSGGGIANRAWSVLAVQAEQSSTDRGLTWHVFDDNDPTYRYLRADGTWSPPLHRADDPFGWINLVTDVETYSTNSIDYRFQSLVADFDATNFAEIEILIKAFGSYDALGLPTSYGIEDSIVIRRQGDEWATFFLAADYETQSRGTWKLRLDDRDGITAAKYSGPLTDNEQYANIHDAPDLPERRMSFNMNIFAEEFDPHALAGFSFHHFPTIYAKCLTSVRIR